MEPSTPTLTHVIPEGNSVGAVTSLGDDVFVARNSVKEVKVYNAETLTLQRRLPVRGLGNPQGLAACASNNCLYVADHNAHIVHRVELTGNNAVMKWSVASDPAGLSVNSAHNVVVACREANKLQEYTTRGTLVREICLQTGVASPWHAVQLSSGQFVVSHHNPSNVSIVGVDGQVVVSYTDSQGSGVGGMNEPRSLAVDKYGCVLVADYNNRILALNPSLTSAQVLPLSADGGLQSPWGLCLDESRGRLYVGEWGGGRVLVFDNVKLVN